MSDTNIIRKFLLETIASLPSPEETSAIDSLTPFNQSGRLNAEIFFNKLSEIVPWHLLNEIKNNPEKAITTPGQLTVVVDVLLHARKIWQEGAIGENFTKLLTAFVIYDRLFMVPEEDLDSNIHREKIYRSMAAILAKMKISVDVNSSSYSGFADKKFLSDFDTAVRTDNLPGIFNFFRALDYGGGLYSVDIFSLQNISRFVSFVNIEDLVLFSSKCTALTQKIVLEAIPRERIPLYVDVLKEASLLSLLIILNGFFNSRHFPNNIEVKNDIDQIGAYIKILEAISTYCKDANTISLVCNTLNVKPNKVTNALFSAFVAMHKDHVLDYIRNIDFSYDDSGETAYRMLVEFGEDSTLEAVSDRISDSYFDFLAKLEYKPSTFMFTSYYNFLLRDVTAKTRREHDIYFNGLEKLSLLVIRAISSWKVDDVAVAVTRWVYWIMAIKQMDLKVYSFDELPLTRHLLFDRKFMSYLATTLNDGVVLDFKWLEIFLVAPDTVDTIDIPSTNKHLQLRWSNQSDR